MDAATFRRDPYLRSSAYHLATWSLTGFVIELQLRAIAAGGGAAFSALPLLLAAGAMTSFTHERRVGKIAGVAGEPVYPGAGRLWLVTFAAAGSASAHLAMAQQAAWLFPVWAVAVGAAFVFWGSRSAFDAYVALGVGLAVVGAADAVATAGGAPLFVPRLLVLGVALPLAALAINRRYLWFR